MRRGFFRCCPSARVRRLKLRQAAPAKLGRSLYYVTCTLFCLVSISAVAMDYSPLSLGAFKLNEAPLSELGCFKLPKSQKSFLPRQTADVSVERCIFDFVTREGNPFYVVIMRDAPRGGSSRVFLCGYWPKNLIRILVSHVILAIPVKVQVPPVYSKSCPHGPASYTLQSALHDITVHFHLSASVTS